MSAQDVQAQLTAFHDPNRYVLVPNRNVFDSHKEEYFEPIYDDKGKPVIDSETKKQKTRKVEWDFDKDELEEIAAINNARNNAGDFSPLAIGHTIRDEPDETKQPELVGAALEYHVGWDEPHNRWMLRANYYIRKEDYERAKSFPFTSIELHPSDKAIHPVSLIRRTPRRDLGAWTFHRATNCYSRAISRFDPRTGRHGTVLRYSRFDSETEEPNMADMPTDTPPAAPPAMDDHEMTEQYMRDCLPHIHAIASHPHHGAMVQKYMAQPEPAPVGTPDSSPAEDLEKKDEPPIQNAAQPSATNGSMPKPIERAGSTDDEVKRMQREQEAIKFSRLESRLDALEKENKQLQDERKQDAIKFARSESENVAKQLVYEGFDIDIPTEVDRMAPMTPDQRAKHADYVRQYHRKAPVDVAPFVGRRDPVTPAMGGVDDDTATAKHEMEVLQFQRKHKGMTWEQAEEAIAKKKSGGAAATNGVSRN